MDELIKSLAAELGQKEEYVDNVVRLLDEGNTIPFIARYRKELHGAMDDTTLRNLETRLQYLRGLQERRESILNAISEQGKLTEELAEAIHKAATLAELEDLYRPYKQKRRTRATVAKEKGLEPLARQLFDQKRDCPDPAEAATAYVDPEKGVETVEDALAGASDIIAEWISDDAALRKSLRELIQRQGKLRSEAAVEEDSVYRLYYDFTQSVNRLQGHQILAINRGEKEKFLKVGVELEHELAMRTVYRAAVIPGNRAMDFVKAAALDAYDRLLFPSLERETRSDLTDTACEGAIGQFALNLRPLLMQPPVKGKVTMGLDPGYRMGCKVAVVDGTGKVLDTAVVYPTYGERQKNEAIRTLAALVRKHGVEHIAIGNGTASRETEQMAVELIHQENERGAHLSYMIVSEAGASVYSASKLAAEEFPQYDVNLRSAVSIARRLQDPLAELVKIEPKAIGVGQYQHDMPEKQLDEALDGGREHRVPLAAPAGVRPDGHDCQEHRQLPGGKRRLHRPQPAAEGVQAGAQGLPAVRGLPAGAGEQERAGQHRRPPGVLCGGNGAFEAHRPRHGRHSRRQTRRPAGEGEAVRRGEGGSGDRRGPAHADGCDRGAAKARAGYPGFAAPAHPAHGRDGDLGPETGDEALRHGAKRDRLRRLCGHRRTPGRPGPHLRDRRPLYPPPLRGPLRGRRGAGGGAGRGRKEKAHQPLHQTGVKNSCENASHFHSCFSNSDQSAKSSDSCSRWFSSLA